MKTVSYRVLLREEPEGGYTVTVPTLPGCITYGETIDVVVLNVAPLALRYRVLRDGKVLTCRDEQVRILYQADTVSRYLDFKPVIEQHERAILERARRGELLNGYNPYRGALARYRQQRQRTARAG